MMPWANCIVMSCGLVLIVLTGCVREVVPDLRQIEPAYTKTGEPIPRAVTISRVYLDQLLKDWDACHGNPP